MGQNQHSENVRHHGRGRPQRQTLRRNVSALVSLGLVLTFSGSVAAQSHPDHSQPVFAGYKTHSLSAQQSVETGFDKNNAWKCLVKQCSFGPRVPGTDAHEQCLKYLQNELAQYCDNVTLQPLEHLWSHNRQNLKMNNIIGFQNWKNAKVRIVLLAHWDSRPFASQETDPAKQAMPILGADDGASGVAVMIELARALQHEKMPVGIEYLLDDGEDLGPEIDEMLLGVDYFADHMAEPKPQYGILLDMIGNKGVTVPIELNSYGASQDLIRKFYGFAKTVGLSKTFPDKFGEEIEDDHLPLIKNGVPTIDLIDFNYPYWHTLQDTVDKCSPDSLGNIGTMLYKWFLQPVPYQLPLSDRQ